MDRPRQIADGIFWIGVNDFETELFEGLWPLPFGVAYNSYLINDKKVAVLDTVKRFFLPLYLEKIKSASGGRGVDYLILNHMEPDHSGSVKALSEFYPSMKLVGNKKTVDYIKGFYGIDEGRIIVVDDGGSLEIGSYKLSFYLTPMVHWPETMMTYEPKNGILFSADAFGSYGTLNGGIFDDEMDLAFFEEETRRYYANIVAKYSPMVQKALAHLKDIDIKMIAPTHGAVFRKDPLKIVGLYDRMSRYETEKGAVVAYASMYGNTQLLAEAVARGLSEGGVEQVKLRNVSKTNLSFLLSDIWRYRGVVLGSCTYNTRLFPFMEQLVAVLENDRIKNHVFGIFGSCSWTGGAVKALTDFVQKIGEKPLEPVVEAKFAPTEGDLERCRELGRNMASCL